MSTERGPAAAGDAPSESDGSVSAATESAATGGAAATAEPVATPDNSAGTATESTATESTATESAATEGAAATAEPVATPDNSAGAATETTATEGTATAELVPTPDNGSLQHPAVESAFGTRAEPHHKGKGQDWLSPSSLGTLLGIWSAFFAVPAAILEIVDAPVYAKSILLTVSIICCLLLTAAAILLSRIGGPTRWAVGAAMFVAFLATCLAWWVPGLLDPPVDPPRASPGQATDTLASGQTLRAEQRLRSPKGAYILKMQPDGNLILFNSPGVHVWSSETFGNDQAYVRVEHNGDVTIRRPDGRPVWSARTGGNPGAHLEVRDDGNIVVRSARGSTLWETGTLRSTLRRGESLSNGGALVSPNGRFVAALQVDGNLVIHGTGPPLWATGTSHPDNYLRMEASGNLILYSLRGEELWSTGTEGNEGAFARIEDTGVLVVYSSPGDKLWASDTP